MNWNQEINHEEKKFIIDSWKNLGKHSRGFFICLFLMFILFYLISLFNIDTHRERTFSNAVQKSPQEQQNDLTFRQGDLVFQRTSGELSQVIAHVTQSPLTHCGITDIDHKGNIIVIEAGGDGVVETSLKQWILNGVDKKFALARPRGISDEGIQKTLQSARKYLGLPYDFKYQWDDQQLYCSELVYKAYKEGAGIELCPFVELKNLHYQGQEEFIKNLMDGQLPLDRQLITPVDIFRSSHVEIIYDDFTQNP